MGQPPTPEELQKEFAEFIQNKFGGSVHVIASEVQGVDEPVSSTEKPTESPDVFERILNFRYTPKEIKTYLDRFVVEQEEAKKALSIAVCDHFHYLKRCLEDGNAFQRPYAKQNILLAGPTGVGKTYLIRLIAELVGVPFVKADATRFTEAGYVGANVEELIRDLVAQAGGNVELAQYGIIYLDEADKLAGQSSGNGRETRDVSGRGVQFGLLKLMEETEIDLMSGSDPASYMHAMMEFQRKGKVEKKIVNTKSVLFIVSGTFLGVYGAIRRRLHAGTVGFAGNPISKLDSQVDDFREVTTQDLVASGFEPEFVGRLPVRVSCAALKAKDLLRVLKESEGSILRQYEAAFEAYGVKIVWERDALERIADLAVKEGTGARGLMTILERKLRDFKFEIPSLPVKELRVTRSLIDDPQAELRRLLEDFSRDQVVSSAPSQLPGLIRSELQVRAKSVEVGQDSLQS